MVNNVDFEELKNLLLSHDFNIESIKNGLSNFQLIDTVDKLGATGETLTPQIVFNYAPEQSIISIDTLASNEWPVNAAGHLWAITSSMNNNSRPIPIICFWCCSSTNEMFYTFYNGNGSEFKWYYAKHNKPKTKTITHGNAKFVYRDLGDFCEFEFTSNSDRFSTQTTIGTIDLLPKTGDAYFLLTLWDNSANPSGLNAIRITTSGSVQVITRDTWVHGHGVFSLGSD